MRVLVVDDADSVRLFVATLLKKWGYEVHQASDGEEAWSLLSESDIQLVVSDWMMPRLDGVGLCKRIRSEPLAHYIYILLLTAKESKESLVEAMEAGADDFLTKPINVQELRVRVRAAERVLELEHQLKANNRHLEKALGELREIHDRMERDLEAAARMQLGHLENTSTGALPVEALWLYRPAAKVAGDTLHFYPLDEHRLVFYLIDVSGHGIQAAMLSMSLHNLLSVRGGSNALTIETSLASQPSRLTGELNARFLSQADTMQYFTMIYGVLDTRSGRGRFCQAGHPPPLLRRCDGTVEPLGTGGFPVGLFGEAEYTDVAFEMEPGSRLLVYSDGVTDVVDPSGALWGDERLRQWLATQGDTDLAHGLSDLEGQLRHYGAIGEGAAFEDDFSLLALELIGEGRARARQE